MTSRETNTKIPSPYVFCWEFFWQDLQIDFTPIIVLKTHLINRSLCRKSQDGRTGAWRGQLTQDSTDKWRTFSETFIQNLHPTPDSPLFPFSFFSVIIWRSFLSLPPRDAAQTYFPLGSMETKWKTPSSISDACLIKKKRMMNAVELKAGPELSQCYHPGF